MDIVEVRALAIPDIKVIRFARYSDHRGYFSESFRRSDIDSNPDTSFLRGLSFVQSNESYSKSGTIRGLHFQWNPKMGKLVRTIHGRMIDLGLDIRKGSPTFGKIVAYDMPTRPDDRTSEWIWLPPGFAHGNAFAENTIIEYYCTGSYNPACEASISPLAQDLDWSECDTALRETYEQLCAGPLLVSDKDRDGMSLAEWDKDSRSENFVFHE